MRILFVTYWFPPSNEVGAVRTGRFVESLVDAGHEMRVVAGPSTADRSLRVPLSEDLIRRVPVVGETSGTAARRSRIPGSRLAPASLRRHYHALRSIPDSKSQWRRPGLRAGTALLQEWRPDVIVASGPPYTALLVARALNADAAPLKSSTLSIGYFGRLYNGLRDPSALFAAITLLGSNATASMSRSTGRIPKQ